MYLLHFLVGIAATSVATAQFIFPDASSSLRLKTAIEIQWNTAALQPPLAINLVPAGSTIRQDIIIQQIGVNIGNTGSLTWMADKTIAAFPQFAMVIVDARGRVVVSQPFAIQSLTRQPSQIIGGSRSGIEEKQNADKNGGQKVDGIQNEKGHGTGSEGGKATGSKEGTNKQQKEQTGIESDTTSKLLTLPGLPTNKGESASLQPLPNAATTTTATLTSIEAPEEVPTVIGVINNTKKPLVWSTSSSPSATDKQSPQRPTTQKGSPPASTTLPQQAKAVDGPSEAKSQSGQGFSVIQGPFTEQTNIPAPVLLPSLKGQVTITTAITPRPLGQISVTDISSRTNTPSAAEAAQPTVLSGGRRLSPDHILGLVCVSFGWGLRIAFQQLLHFN